MPQKNVFHKKINKKVNKQNIRNSENWLFDDVSEIYFFRHFCFSENGKSLHVLNLEGCRGLVLDRHQFNRNLGTSINDVR